MEDLLPQPTDILFIEETSPDKGAWLKNPANKFFLYSEGYKEAGKNLYDFCIGNSFYATTLIYPLVFTYRQFLELRLKELLIMGYRYLDIKKDFADQHNLMSLWNAYKTEILPGIGMDEIKIIENAERIINQFNSEDPTSMAFRYPVSKAPERKASLCRDTIDLKNFKEVIDRLIYFLDWQWDVISHYEDNKAEMISEMYREYYR